MAILSVFKSPKYILNHPVEVTVKKNDKTFYSSYDEANIMSSGSTEDEAVARLEGVFIVMYEKLNRVPENRLEPALLKHRQIINSLITKVATPSI